MNSIPAANRAIKVRKTSTRILAVLAALAGLNSAFAAGPAGRVVSLAQPGTIHYFVEQDDLARVRTLLKQQPSLKEQHQSFLGTPLAVAAADGRLDMVRFLLSQRVYVNARCSDEYDSQTVLMAACTGNPFPESTRLAIVKALVDAGALVRVVDRSGYTALHTAAYYGHADVVNYLLDKGADMMATDQDGRTPFSEAMRGAAMWDDWRLMRFIRVAIAQGANVNGVSAVGETMLDLAARAGKVHTMEYLLLQGAEINAKDRAGRTALDIAVERGQTDAASTLRSHGALSSAAIPSSGTPAESTSPAAPVAAAATSAGT